MRIIQREMRRAFWRGVSGLRDFFEVLLLCFEVFADFEVVDSSASEASSAFVSLRFSSSKIGFWKDLEGRSIGVEGWFLRFCFD